MRFGSFVVSFQHFLKSARFPGRINQGSQIVSSYRNGQLPCNKSRDLSAVSCSQGRHALHPEYNSVLGWRGSIDHMLKERLLRSKNLNRAGRHKGEVSEAPGVIKQVNGRFLSDKTRSVRHENSSFFRKKIQCLGLERTDRFCSIRYSVQFARDILWKIKIPEPSEITAWVLIPVAYPCKQTEIGNLLKEEVE